MNLFKGVAEKLLNTGIKNTLQLYDKVLTEKKRRELSEKTQIPISEIYKLTCLTDLSRIKWVNHTFAFMLYESGYQSAVEVANARPQVLYESVRAFNKQHKILRHNIGLNDIKRTIEAAQGLDSDINFDQ